VKILSVSPHGDLSVLVDEMTATAQINTTKPCAIIVRTEPSSIAGEGSHSRSLFTPVTHNVALAHNGQAMPVRTTKDGLDIVRLKFQADLATDFSEVVGGTD